MSTLLAIDPGKRSCGVAVFHNGLLCFACYVDSRTKEKDDLAAARDTARAVCETIRHYDLTEMIAETPQIYQREEGKTKGDPNHMPPLAMVNGGIAIGLAIPKVACVFPAGWKGQMKKDITERINPCGRRVLQRLSPSETAAIRTVRGGPPDIFSLDHNTLDAIGVGLWYLGRFDKHRVISRS